MKIHLRLNAHFLHHLEYINSLQLNKSISYCSKALLTRRHSVQLSFENQSSVPLNRSISCFNKAIQSNKKNL